MFVLKQSLSEFARKFCVLSIRYNRLIGASAMLALSTSGAYAQNLEFIAGRWSHDNSGEIVEIRQNFAGWEMNHSRFGQFSMSTADLAAGANIKISGRGATPGSVITCYIYISPNLDSGMTWSLRQGPSDACLFGKFSKIPTEQELREEEARKQSELKAREARVAADIAAKNASDARAKAEADVAASLAAEAAKIAQREAERSKQEQAQKVQTAENNRLQLTIRSRSAPMELRDVEIVYFEKDNDEGKVRKAFDEKKIIYDARRSENNVNSNILGCGPSVPLEATKTAALTLIESGVPLRIIQPSFHPQFANRLTLEGLSWAEDYPVITKDQIKQMTSCDYDFNRIKKPYVVNNCARGDVDVYFLYYDALKKAWIMGSEGAIEYGERRELTDDDHNELHRGSKNLWYYAEVPGTSTYWDGSSQSESVSRYIASVRSTKSFKKKDANEISLTCGS